MSEGEFKKQIEEIYAHFRISISMSDEDIERLKKSLSERNLSDDMVIPSYPNPKDSLFKLIDEAKKEFPDIIKIAHTTRTSDDARYIYVGRAQRWFRKWFGEVP